MGQKVENAPVIPSKYHLHAPGDVGIDHTTEVEEGGAITGKKRTIRRKHQAHPVSFVQVKYLHTKYPDGRGHKMSLRKTAAGQKAEGSGEGVDPVGSKLPPTTTTWGRKSSLLSLPKLGRASTPLPLHCASPGDVI